MRRRLIAVAGSFGVGISLVKYPVLIALMAPGIVFGLALVAFTRFMGRSMGYDEAAIRRLLRWTVAAFGIHLAIGLLITASGTLTNYLGPDAITYDFAARSMADRLNGGASPFQLAAGREGFSYLLGTLYFVLGGFRESGLVMNAAFSAALIPLGTDATLRMTGPVAARNVAPILLFLPWFVVWPSQLLREASILFFLAAAAAAAVRLTKRPSLGGMAVLAGSIAALSLTGLLVLGGGLGYSGYALSSGTDLGRVNTIRKDSATSESGFGKEADVSTPKRAITYLPQGLAYVSAGPFPWQVRGLRQVPALLEAMCLWALFPSLLRGIRLSFRQEGRRALVLLLPTGALLGMLALFVGNYGTIVRMRVMVLVLLLPFLALGLAARKERRQAGRDRRIGVPPVLATVRGQ
jgi:hypothetical protein